jgi:hypothetical protein
MKNLLLILSFALLAPFTVAHAAGELDNEDQVKNARRFAADLPQTLVVRVNQNDGKVSVLHSDTLLPAGQELGFEGARFTEVKVTEGMRQELDGDSSTSGWYFFWNNYNYYYPTYYYYGYNYYYQPYYSYYNYYQNCNYYWYRWY